MPPVTVTQTPRQPAVEPRAPGNEQSGNIGIWAGIGTLGDTGNATAPANLNVTGNLTATGDILLNRRFFQIQSAANNLDWMRPGGYAAPPLRPPMMLVAGDSTDYTTGVYGYIRGNSPPATPLFPAAVAGLADLAAGSQGNALFGLYGLTQQYALGTTVACELTTRNYVGAPSTALPPNNAFGTSAIVPVGLQITAGGPYDSALGLFIAKEGGENAVFWAAQYIKDFGKYGLFIEAQPTGNQVNIHSANNGNDVNLSLLTTGPMQPGNAVFMISDNTATRAGIRQNGDIFSTGNITLGNGWVIQGTPRFDIRAPSQPWTLYAEINGDFAIAGEGYKPGGAMWADLSDIRVKQDVTDYERGLEAVTQLRPVVWRTNGRAGTAKGGPLHHGLVADEVREIMPEMVGAKRLKLDEEDAEETELLTLNSTALLYALVNAVKQLAAKLDVGTGYGTA